jgi:hypothetical protein
MEISIVNNSRKETIGGGVRVETFCQKPPPPRTNHLQQAPLVPNTDIGPGLHFCIDG